MLRELGAQRMAAAVIFSSGFSEIGGEGVALEIAFKAAIREGGVRGQPAVNREALMNLISAVSRFGQRLARGCRNSIPTRFSPGLTTPEPSIG